MVASGEILAHVVLVAARLICGEFGGKLGLQLVMGGAAEKEKEELGVHWWMVWLLVVEVLS